MKDAVKHFAPVILLILICSFAGLWLEREQKASYEAYIEPTEYEGSKIFCIANVSTVSGETDILSLRFPHDHIQYCDNTYYDWDSENNHVTVSTGETSYDVRIELISKINRQSYKKLNRSYTGERGEAFASENSYVFHIHFSGAKCPYGERILDENIIDFHDARDAEIMGLRMCEWCREKW